jgi:hypothetical protein
MKYLFVFLILLTSCFSQAEELSNASQQKTQQEIAHLISYLEASGCRFNRNGTWYEAPDAVKHINKKYQYLLDKNAVSTAEVFIEKAASESSMSGKAYLVQCANAQPEASAIWFSAELKKYRQTNPIKRTSDAK